MCYRRFMQQRYEIFFILQKKIFIYREGASYARLTRTKYARHVDGLQSAGGVETSDAHREGRASCIEVCVGGAYLRRRTERVADDDDEAFCTFGSLVLIDDFLVERLVERTGVLVSVSVAATSVTVAAAVLSALTALPSRASRAAITSSREGTQSFFSKLSRRAWMLSCAR